MPYYKAINKKSIIKKSNMYQLKLETKYKFLEITKLLNKWENGYTSHLIRQKSIDIQR